jgi:hypothetical protein
LPLAQNEFEAPIPIIWKTWFGPQSNLDWYDIWKLILDSYYCYAKKFMRTIA